VSAFGGKPTTFEECLMIMDSNLPAVHIRQKGKENEEDKPD
jgi:hypothetical protein